MNLHQINVSYDGGEDRILLRFSTTARVEYRFWLTRRLVKALGPALIARLQPEAEAPEQAHAEAVMAFRHEAALQQNRFEQNYAPAEPAPETAAAPILVQRVQHQRSADGQHVLALAPAEGPVARIQLSDVLMHGLIKLIDDALKLSEWDFRWAPQALAPAAQTMM